MSLNIKFIYPPFLPDHFIALENRKADGARFSDRLTPRTICEKVDLEKAAPPTLAHTLEKNVLVDLRKFISQCTPFDNELYTYFAAESLQNDLIKRVNARRKELKTEADLYLLYQEVIHDLKTRIIFERIARSRAMMHEFMRLRGLATTARHKEFMRLLHEALHDHAQRINEREDIRKKENEIEREVLVEPRFQAGQRREELAKAALHPKTQSAKESLAAQRLKAAKQKAKGTIAVFEQVKWATTKSQEQKHTPHTESATPTGAQGVTGRLETNSAGQGGDPHQAALSAQREGKDIDVAQRLARDIIEGRQELEFHVNLQETNQKLAAMELMAHYINQELPAPPPLKIKG